MLDSQFVTCPYCGESFEAVVDSSFGSTRYIEDCPVCCRPININLTINEDGQLDGLATYRDDD